LKYKNILNMKLWKQRSVEISSRCGWGKEMRLVICVDKKGRRRSRRRCRKDLRPESRQACYSGPCKYI
jgi:hypothetical protein